MMNITILPIFKPLNIKIPFKMLLSRNKIKYLASLKIRKFRMLHGQFIVEGDKIVSDLLADGETQIRLIVASPEWIAGRLTGSPRVSEILEGDATGISRITSLETPPPVIAVLDIPPDPLGQPEILQSASIVLDNVQDPGNLGTIIRTANWFGFSDIICGKGCADCYNPKAVQASMGAVLRIKMHYMDLPSFFRVLDPPEGFEMYGTFMQGIPVSELHAMKNGFVVFGNESKGISDEIIPYIKTRITIPPQQRNGVHVESLNVASAAAIVCAKLSGQS
jgi:TrmH family RNA methyltransferase